MSDWRFIFAVDYSACPWTEHEVRLPFFRVWRGEATGTRYLKCGRFLITIECETSRLQAEVKP
jgi:hypothetical protein